MTYRNPWRTIIRTDTKNSSGRYDYLWLNNDNTDAGIRRDAGNGYSDISIMSPADLPYCPAQWGRE